MVLYEVAALKPVAGTQANIHISQYEVGIAISGPVMSRMACGTVRKGSFRADAKGGIV